MSVTVSDGLRNAPPYEALHVDSILGEKKCLCASHLHHVGTAQCKSVLVHQQKDMLRHHIAGLGELVEFAHFMLCTVIDDVKYFLSDVGYILGRLPLLCS